MKVLKNIVIFILQIILTVALTITLILNIASSTIISKEYVLSKLDENNYYNQVFKQAESNFEKYIYQSGLDESVIKDLITEEQVKQDTLKIVDNIFEGKNENISTEEIEQRLRTKIKNSVKQDQVLQKDAVDVFVKTISTEYTDTLFHTKYEKDVNEAYLKIIEYISKIKTLANQALVISVILIIMVNVKTILVSITNIGVGLLATGGFLGFINVYINSKINIKNITIFNSDISIVLRSIFEEIFEMLTKNGTTYIIVGALLIVVSQLIFNKKNEENKKV